MGNSFQRGAFLSLQGICHAPNTLTSRFPTGGTANHNRCYHRRGCPGPNCKEGRRDSSHSKVMRLFEKSSPCLDEHQLLVKISAEIRFPQISNRYLLVCEKYAAQPTLPIDAEIAEKGHFWMDTTYWFVKTPISWPVFSLI